MPPTYEGSRHGGLYRLEGLCHGLTMADDTFAGPVNHVALALPSGADLAPVAEALAGAVAAGAVELLDIEWLVRDEAGSLTRATLAELPALSGVAAAETDLLDADDIAALAAEVSDGHGVLVVVYEDRSLASLAQAAASVGGHEIWSGGVSIDDLEQSLTDELEVS